jgi:hypothetical protein
MSRKQAPRDPKRIALRLMMQGRVNDYLNLLLNFPMPRNTVQAINK